MRHWRFTTPSFFHHICYFKIGENSAIGTLPPLLTYCRKDISHLQATTPVILIYAKIQTYAPQHPCYFILGDKTGRHLTAPIFLI